MAETNDMGIPVCVEQAGTADRERLLDGVADAITSRQLTAPAIFLLESVRPLNFIGSQLMHALGPLASMVIEPARWNAVAEALEDRATLESLIRRIESRERKSSQPS